MLSVEDEQANLRALRRLLLSITASDGKLNLLVAVCDRRIDQELWTQKYEAELTAKGIQCHRIHLTGKQLSLRQGLVDLQTQGIPLGRGTMVTALGASELLDLRLGDEKSDLERLLFSLQWTREALRAFACPIVLWVSNPVADALATASPDFWSWRGNALFEFQTPPIVVNWQGSTEVYEIEPEVVIIRPPLDDEQSELGKTAREEWQALDDLLATEPDSPLLASLYQNLGFTERDRGNWESAASVLKKAIQLHRRAGNRSGESRCLGCLGDVERNRGNWDAAERLYRQMLEMCEELGDRSGMASSWGVLGDIERDRGNWDAAERLYRQSLQLREELGDRSGMAAVWGVLGNIERKRGNWDAAERLYRQSLQLREELGDREGIAWVTSDRGANELGRGNLDLAESLLQEALLQVQQLGMKHLNAETNWHLARLYRAKNNPDLAEHHYQTAHQLYSQLGAAKDLEKIEREWHES